MDAHMMRSYSGVYSWFILDERIVWLFCCAYHVIVMQLRTCIVYYGIYVHTAKDTTVRRSVFLGYINVTAVTVICVRVDDV